MRAAVSDMGAEGMFEPGLKGEDSFLISLQVHHLDSVQSVLKINVFQALHFSWISHPALGLFTCLLDFKEAFLSSRYRGTCTNSSALYLDAVNRW